MMRNILLINAEGVQAICLSKSLRKQGHRVVGFCNHKCTSVCILHVSRFAKVHNTK